MGQIAVVLAAFATEFDGGAAVAVLATADIEGTCFVTRRSVATALGSGYRSVGRARRADRTGDIGPIAQ